MPIKVMNKSVPVGQTCSFDFGEAVSQYVVGIAYWSFSAKSATNVTSVSLGLASNHPSANTVTVKVNGLILSGSSNVIDTTKSTVVVSCVAMTKEVNQNIVMANEYNIPNKSTSPQIQFTSNSQDTVQTFVSGFNMAFQQPYPVQEISGATGYTSTGLLGNINCLAQMVGQSGEFADSSLDTGLLMSGSSSNGFLSDSVIGTTTSSVDFGQNITEAVVLLQDFALNYEYPQTVLSMSAGCPDWSVSGSKVALNGVVASMSNGSISQASSSSVNLAVIAVPDSP